MYATFGTTSLRDHRSTMDAIVHFIVIMMVTAAMTFMFGAALLGLL